jgi:hypothetical protein
MLCMQNLISVLAYQVINMSKRWLLFLGLYLTTLSAISFGIDFKVDNRYIPLGCSAQGFETEQVDIGDFGIGDYFSDEARLGRGFVNTISRLKLNISSPLCEDLGLEFLACKLIRSYSEIHLDDYVVQLTGNTIQVNAP